MVTGAAGFIGSTLAERLVLEGHEVIGIDSLTDYYPVATKEANLGRLRQSGAFSLHVVDLATAELASLVEGADLVFHLAGQPGVRLSWAEGFALYETRNVLATQRLLEAVARAPGPRPRLIYSSSSSVYGIDANHPTSESDPTRPHSPYGVTKLAGEHLCHAYRQNWDVDVLTLRYFTVYGPRQRPDMAFHRLIEAGLTGESFEVYGDGEQVRDFTYVDDVVEANLRCVPSAVPAGSVFNVAGGAESSLNEVIETISDLLGRKVALDRRPPQAGDVRRTGASTKLLEHATGWRPAVASARAGLERQVAWHLARQP